MIVRDLDKRNLVCFKEVEVGEIFKYEGYIYLKISDDFADGIANAYDITNKRKWEFVELTKVNHIPSELILHKSGWEEENV